MTIHFTPLPTDLVRALQRGEPDAYGQTPERRSSDGSGVPCRHCLCDVPAGRDYLVVAHRPFATLQPYAETGPIFLCAEPCKAAAPRPTAPAILSSPHYILRGYDADERIVYGTGAVVPTPDIPMRAERLLLRPGVAFVDIRSASNNFYRCRVVAA